MGRIFISYRRQDSIGIAGRIFDKLTAHFGHADVYLDIDIIPPGVDFIKHINDGMERAQIVLALIGESWLQARGPKGRRLDDPQDFVRIELELAFTKNITIIPVLLGAAIMPKVEKLPESIAGITHLNASHVDLGRDFHPHVDRLIQHIGRHLNGGEVAPRVLPGEDISDLTDRFFKDADAIVNVSPEHSLIVRPKTELLGFKNIINRFRDIEQSDGKKRPLIWVLDLGRQKFDDLDSRMRFLNVQALLSRFKALKRFEDDGAEARWEWLRSRAVIFLLDTRSSGQQPEPTKRPTFAAHNVSLTTLESSWLNSPIFRELYGTNLERVSQRTFAIFFKVTSDWASPCTWDVQDLRYFGYATFSTNSAESDLRIRGLELPVLPAIYVDAFRNVCIAAAHTLEINYDKSQFRFVPGQDAVQHLCYLGYRLMRLDEFVETY